MTQDNAADARSADQECLESGYEPELKRTLGSFQVFAVSFAFISVAVGIFGTYDDVLRNAGPAGIWLWVLVAVGQTLVALVIAQFAARIPLSGSSYQWASRLANPKVGWIFGWLSFCYLGLGVVAVDNALATTALIPLFGMNSSEAAARIITLAVVLIQAVLVIASTRILGWITSAAVGLELVIVIVLAVGLFIAVAISGDGSISNLTSRGIAAGDPRYFALGGGLMAAMIMGIATLVGFDSAANMAEEAKDPFRSVPRAIVGSVVAAAVLGLIFLIALTVAIADIPAVSQSSSPVAAILRHQMGPVVERILLAAIAFAFFSAGLVTLATCSRMVFAMSRDARFPAHQLMRRVSPRTQTPIPATILIVVIAFVLMAALPGDALLQLLTVGGLVGAVLYGLIIVLYLVVRKGLGERENAFSLGRLEMPVAIGALVWSVVVVVVLVSPADASTSVLLFIALLAVGGLYFSALLIFNREVLETEPGAAQVFKH
ncbi:APC family permease [Mycolicibacterium komossense]|uniref:Amino acid permease n=1 Tax=Mycolicibacterium komossense TaxID=1779 RepID=A0ABT3CMA3_9MYCO|nr:amino acid permease [Mycolicibacterium komossense]MCV7230478.1 amino acid permease [Mycolicibacterium komossense]